MPYIKRDNNDNITGYSTGPLYEGQEFLAEDSAEWITYIVTGEFVIKKQAIKEAMYAQIGQGITWQYDNSDDEHIVSLDDEMHNWMLRQLAKFEQGRVDPHGGFVQSGGTQFTIDDDGLKELCVFAGEWGDAISRIRIQEQSDLFDLAYPETPTGTELEDVTAYDPAAIDWSVNWSGPDTAAGWNDASLTQLP